jgi:Na+-transporting methylmalonyl-CoA/oxaloacetate decarboxylase beta subunit
MKVFKNKKIITVLTITTTIITLISASFSFWVRTYLSYRFNTNLNKACSIGIIGGSDGPTSIFIAGIPSSNSITLIFALLSLIGFVYLIFMKRFQK